MAESAGGSVEGLTPRASVLERDERWKYFGNRSLEQHHQLIDGYALHAGVPATVAQHYENARNTWLYAFFNYRLMQVAILQVHLAGEVAIRERARQEGLKSDVRLKELLDLALAQRWLLDTRFVIAEERAEREARHLERMAGLGMPAEPFVGPVHEQDYAKVLVEVFRRVRNALAHGEVILKPNLSWEFLAVRDLINQLFPSPE